MKFAYKAVFRILSIGGASGITGGKTICKLIMILYGKRKEYEYLTDERQFSELLALAERYGIKGPLRQNLIAWLLISDENPFSLACEGRKNCPEGSLTGYARRDIAELRALFFQQTPPYDLCYIPIHPSCDADAEAGALAAALADRLQETDSEEAFFQAICGFYAAYGTGVFGLHKAFYLSDSGELTPVSHLRKVTFDDLWGYERQKEKIIANTAAFVEGRGANNMLLYGDAGTGKSTCVKAALNRFWKDGLRMIQVQKYQFVHLAGVIDLIRRRNYRFVIYMDDLSFEDFEVEYKYLKAAIEGGLEERPSNMLIFATSNRRHLIKETFDEREGGGDIHREESIQEKISLSDRFGLQIRFSKPAQDEYFEIVTHLALLHGLELPKEELIDGARKFAMLHSGFSGRIAAQYILSLMTGSKE